MGLTSSTSLLLPLSLSLYFPFRYSPTFFPHLSLPSSYPSPSTRLYLFLPVSQNPDSYDSCASMWLEVATSSDAPYAEIVLFSLMNTVLGKGSVVCVCVLMTIVRINVSR
jgi:hypothetical protein